MEGSRVDTTSVVSFVSTLRKKMSSLQMRSPIFFTFTVDPVYIRVRRDSGEELEFYIDYRKNPGSIVHEVKDSLREFYPRAECESTETPTVNDMLNEMKTDSLENDVSVDEVYSTLQSRSSNPIQYVIDKVDPDENNLILERDVEGNRKEVVVYHMQTPVVRFLIRYCRGGQTPRQIYQNILQKSDRIVRRFYQER